MWLQDVALLQLGRPAVTSPAVGAVCLPAPALHLQPGTLGTVTGWGRLGVHEGAPHSTTLQVTISQFITPSTKPWIFAYK